MTDQEILNNCLDLLQIRPYSNCEEARDAIRTLARFCFERMMISEEDLTHQEWAALRYDKSKLQAVKLFRARHGKKFTLMEGKKIIEKHMEKEFGFTHFPYTPS